MLTQEEKRDIQERINNKMSDLKERIEEYKELTKPIPPSEAIGRVSRMDAINNKSINDRMLRNSLQKLKNLNTGLKRLENVDFGICIQCKTEININRLLLIPETLKCVKCS